MNLSLGLCRGSSSVSVVAATAALSGPWVSRDPGRAGAEPPAELRVSSQDIVILASAGSEEADPVYGQPGFFISTMAGSNCWIVRTALPIEVSSLFPRQGTLSHAPTFLRTSHMHLVQNRD